MAQLSRWAEALNAIDDDIAEVLRQLRIMREQAARQATMDLITRHPMLIKLLNEFTFELIKARFERLAHRIQISDDWVKRKAKGVKVPVLASDTYATTTHRALAKNAAKFGQASGHLLEEVLEEGFDISTIMITAMGTQTSHPGLRTFVSMIGETDILYEYEIQWNHFYHSKNKYPKLLEQRVQEELGFALFDVEPIEAEFIMDEALKVFSKIVSTADTLNRMM